MPNIRPDDILTIRIDTGSALDENSCPRIRVWSNMALHTKKESAYRLYANEAFMRKGLFDDPNADPTGVVGSLIGLAQWQASGIIRLTVTTHYVEVAHSYAVDTQKLREEISRQLQSGLLGKKKIYSVASSRV